MKYARANGGIVRMVFLYAVFALGPFDAWAAIEVGPDNYLAAVGKAKPGDVIRLKAGTYSDGLPIKGINGTAQAPIVIEAADASNPPQLIASPNRNTVSITNSSYVTLRNLVLDGHNMPVDAVKAEQRGTYAHHITLEGLRIVGYGYDQFTIGISTKCPAWGWIIRRNVIVLPGTGMYLGNSDGRAPFIGGLIEYNLIVDSRGYGIQVKHQIERSLVAGEPVNPQTTIIRHNVITKQVNGSEGHLARPNLLVGHFPPSGAGKDDRYLIYGNFLYGNQHEALFQGEGNVALYANLFVNPFGDAVHIQPHNDVPRNIWIFDNTVVAARDGIELNGDVDDYLHVLRGNVVFARNDATRLYRGNITGPYSDADKYLVAPYLEPGKLNLQLKRPSSARNSSRADLEKGWPDVDRDFEGNRVKDDNVGAYGVTASTVWTPSIALKPIANPKAPVRVQ